MSILINQGPINTTWGPEMLNSNWGRGCQIQIGAEARLGAGKQYPVWNRLRDIYAIFNILKFVYGNINSIFWLKLHLNIPCQYVSIISLDAWCKPCRSLSSFFWFSIVTDKNHTLKIPSNVLKSIYWV